MRRILGRARKEPARIVLADGYNERVLRAAAQVVREGTARIVLIGKTEKIHRFGDELGIDLDGVECIHPPRSRRTRGTAYADELYKRRERKGLTLAAARARAYQPVYFASMMVRAGDADAMVAGIDSNYPDILRPALEVIGTSPTVRRVSGLHMVAFRDRDPLFFADTTVNIDPDPVTLAEIAISAAGFVRDLGIEPRIGMLSFSNFGSVRHPEADKVREAVTWVKFLAPWLAVDGEMQADVAVDEHIISQTYPFSDLTGPANVLVFPTLSASNASYKLISQLGNAEVIGPILLGMNKPVHILQRGCSVLEVVHLIGIASVDARTPRNHIINSPG